MERPKSTIYYPVGPGPGAYLLPGAIGTGSHHPSIKQNPAYSMAKRTKQFSTISTMANASPGPIYNIGSKTTRRGKDGVVAYSMPKAKRMRTKKIPDKSPGPAAYNTASVGNVSRHSKAPAYTFGLKTSVASLPSSKQSTPGPSSYSLPGLCGKSTIMKPAHPCYSMVWKPKTNTLHEELGRSPGPGAYSSVHPDVYMAKGPAFTMCSKPPIKLQKVAPTPGPAAHRTEKVIACHRRAPKYTFGLKHSLAASIMKDKVQ